MHGICQQIMINENINYILGTYKRSDDEAFIDVGFDVNGTKHLDASLGYTRTRFNHGYVYQPKVYLAINSERVAALSGISTQR